jgi:hypothetical protein
MASVNLASFFRSLMDPNAACSIMVVGDSMTAEGAQKGTLPQGIWSTWEPPIKSGRVSGWLGRCVPCNNTALGTLQSNSQASSSIIGGTATTTTPTTGLSGYPTDRSVQTSLSIAWGAAARTAGTNIFYGSFLRENQQGVTLPWFGTAKGPNTIINRSQQSVAELIYLANASSPASNVEVYGSRRATNANNGAYGAIVGSATAVNFTTNAGTVKSVVVDCGTGAGEAGLELRSTAANVGAETIYLLNAKWIAYENSTTPWTSGWFLSILGAGGLNSIDIARLVGCTDTRPSGSLTAVASSDISEDQIRAMGRCTASVLAPTHYIIRLGQNLNVSGTNPSADYVESSPAIGNTNYENHKKNMRLIVNRLIEISLAANGTIPYILFVPPIRTSTTESTTQAVNQAQKDLAYEYNAACWDSYERTKNVPTYWYTSAENQSTGGDNVHESYYGCQFIARMIFEDGLRSLGLDPGEFGGSSRLTYTPAGPRLRGWR